MMKTLRELGEEYEAAAIGVKGRIAVKRERLRSCGMNEAYELKSELRTLYAEYHDACEIANYLKGYYEPHSGKRELFPS